MWVVSKNESNCLLENKMVSTLIWRNVILLYVVKSNILWLTFKLSYHYRCNILCTVSFLLYIATKKLKQNHYFKQFYECSYHKKNNSCTLCVPMFFEVFMVPRPLAPARAKISRTCADVIQSCQGRVDYEPRSAHGRAVKKKINQG